MPVSTLLPVNVGTYTGQRILRTNLLKSSENERRLWETEMTREDEQKNMPAIGFGFFSWCVLFGFLGEYCNAFSTYKGYTHAQLCSLRFVCVCVCMCVHVLVDEANVQETRELELPKPKNTLCARRSDLRKREEDTSKSNTHKRRTRSRTFIALLRSNSTVLLLRCKSVHILVRTDTVFGTKVQALSRLYNYWTIVSLG